ncbi:MAG TPA: hypothetical protein VK543_04680 [Puia sp.]|nr:hypothetical protein [Puia sp.]
MNLRGFGIFLFNNGKEKLGREFFTEALGQNLTDNDENKSLKADTYLLLSDLEKDCNNKENFEFNLFKAMEICSTITNARRKDEMQDVVRSKLPKA